MATIPGAAVIPTKYGESVLVYSEERVECVVDGAPPGDNGRLFVIEAGTAKRVPYEVWRFIRDHLGFTGAVEVSVTEVKDELGNATGTKFDLDKAKQESAAKLKTADQQRFAYWVSGVIEDYVKRNKPVPQPDAAIQRVIDRQGYDLRSYGIVPIGWKERNADAEMQALKESNAKLQKQLADLMTSLGGK